MPPRVPRLRTTPLPALPLPGPVRLRYYVLWKPFGVLARFGSDALRPTLDCHAPLPGLFPVGRMDADTEGLLLLTDDPGLCRSLARSSSLEPRLWLAQVDGAPTPEALESLRHGPSLSTRSALPLEVRAIPEPDLPSRPVSIRHRLKTPTRWLELRVFEGWSRHVRRLTAAVGHPTLRLLQWGLGPVDLAGMAPGQLRELTPDETHWAEQLASEAPERRAARPGRDWTGERLARQGRVLYRDERTDRNPASGGGKPDQGARRGQVTGRKRNTPAVPNPRKKGR
jgi:23S rRNA pseudouridine2457 synthase